MYSYSLKNNNSANIIKSIIKKSGCDIICLNETFLKRNETIIIEGYTSLCHNRKNINPKACRGSGGVAILVRTNILETYYIQIIDNSFENIQWLKLIDSDQQGNNITICSCYLPREGSSRGNKEQEFFDKLKETIHNHIDENLIIICSDFNSRIRKLKEAEG